MIEIREIKKFLLRAINGAAGPMPDLALNQAAKDSLAPRPLQSDIDHAKRELESSGLIIGNDDDLCGRSWGLSTKGELQAKKIG